MTRTKAAARPERILELSERLNAVAGEKIGEIASVNRAAKMLVVNAQVVAARSGEAGRSFMVVAEEFKRISGQIDDVAGALEQQVKADLTELSDIGGSILGQLRGQRLADLALNAIEIIDRNLYERTCDVRWWATDSAVVDCVAEPSPDRAQHASARLGVILDAYTVYLDLWICDRNGTVVANGRPGRYPVQGESARDMAWFRDAMATKSGDDFAVADIARLAGLKGAPTATYATAIRAGGLANGAVIGVLGIHFDWESQAQTVVDGVRLTPEEKTRTRVLLLDQRRRVLAASDGQGLLTETLELDVTGGGMGSYGDGKRTIGYALTPGYETYRGLGWYGCLVQDAAAI